LKSGFEAILDGLEAQLTADHTPAGQNVPTPPRHGQKPPDGPGLASAGKTTSLETVP
jgi:hypothetical protein